MKQYTKAIYNKPLKLADFFEFFSDGFRNRFSNSIKQKRFLKALHVFYFIVLILYFAMRIISYTTAKSEGNIFIDTAIISIALIFFFAADIISILKAIKCYKDYDNLERENYRTFFYQDHVDNIMYKDITNQYETKNLYVLVTKNNIMMLVRKDGFVKGNPKELMKFIVSQSDYI